MTYLDVAMAQPVMDDPKEVARRAGRAAETAFFLVETTEDEEFGTMVHGDVYYQRGAMNGSFEPVFVFIVSPKTDRHVGNLENAVEA